MKKVYACGAVLLMSVLLAACATPLMKAVEKGDLGSATALLDSGANVNETVPNGRNALHWAFLKRQATVDLVRLLLERGVDVNAQDQDKRTALYWAVATDASPDVVRLLLDRGAGTEIGGLTYDVKTKTWSLKTPLQVARERGKTVTTRMIEEREHKTADAYAAGAGVRHNGQPRGDAQSPVSSDVDELPQAKRRTSRSSYAIVVGIETYRQKLPDALHAAQDAKVVTGYLTRALGYPEEHIITLLNERASYADLVKYFEKWLPNNVEPGSTLFVYYSGHGAPNPKTGDAYLVPYDGDPAFIDETGYPLKRLYAALGKLPVKEIIVALDSCFSGAGGRSVIAKGARPIVLSIENPILASRNMTVLSASAGDQISSTYDEKGHGLFTYFMLKGIKNEDVVRQDGSLDVASLFDYIKPQVSNIARKKYNNEQTPQLIGAGK